MEPQTSDNIRDLLFAALGALRVMAMIDPFVIAARQLINRLRGKRK
ncbi:hypothetical protein [Paraburkholderia sp. RAU2J]|nr:hypothetical protein [Paraburkholderia sp. RAU2J]